MTEKGKPTVKIETKHNWEKLKAEYFASEYVSVSAWSRAQFGIKAGKAVPGYITARTKGRSGEKLALSKSAQEEAQDIVAKTMSKQWEEVIKDCAEAEIILIKHVVEMITEEIKNKRYKQRKMSDQRIEFLIKTLRTVQGKANEYTGNEGGDESPMDKRLRELGYLNADGTEKEDI